MFISKLKIRNFRCFTDFEVHFTEDVNVIIGHNCTGKSNLLRGLALVFDHGAKRRLGIDDFNKHMSLEELRQCPPKISITAVMTWSSKIVIPAHNIKPLWQPPVLDHH